MAKVAERTVTVGQSAGRAVRDWRVNEAAMSGIIASAALDSLQHYQRAGQFPVDRNDYITKVNNRIGHGREYLVKPKGPMKKAITYTRYMHQVDWVPAALALLAQLKRRSIRAPKLPWDARSGVPFRMRHHQDSYVLIRGNKRIAGPGPRFFDQAARYIKRAGSLIQPGMVLSIANIQPYAERIERGWSMRVPTGILRFVAKSRAAKSDTLFKRYEVRPLPASVAQEAQTQGRTVIYADRKKGRLTGVILKRHRAYPILHFGPPTDADTVQLPTNRQWSGTADIYKRQVRVEEIAGAKAETFAQQRKARAAGRRRPAVRIYRNVPRSRDEDVIFYGRVNFRVT